MTSEDEGITETSLNLQEALPDDVTVKSGEMLPPNPMASPLVGRISTKRTPELKQDLSMTPKKQVSILPIFYEQPFHIEVYCAVFM
jgi:hypothetical protein